MSSRSVLIAVMKMIGSSLVRARRLTVATVSKPSRSGISTSISISANSSQSSCLSACAPEHARTIR